MSVHSLIASLSNPLTAPEREEFLTKTNTLDVKYLSFILKEHLTEKLVRGLVNEKMGAVIFNNKEATNQVQKDLFFNHYIFGTYPNVRGWIGYFSSELDLVLTREKLFEYLTTN